MKIGYCANVNFLLNGDEQSRAVFDAVLKTGYDYIEMPLSTMLNLTTEQYFWLKRRLDDAGVPCRANFLLFPHDLQLVGEGRDLKKIVEHAKKALPIAADLGSKKVVFGNGGSRRVKEGMQAETVRQELVEILQAVEPVAAENGVVIALEPLCSRETNMVNSFLEAAQMTRQAGDHVGAVCDLYHVITDGQSPDEILKAPRELVHMHIAYPSGRTVPSYQDDRSDYLRLKSAAQACGYNGTLSIEAGQPAEKVWDTISEAYRLLREIFA